MPKSKPIDLNVLKQVLSPTPIAKNPYYFLFTLGTDTAFTPLPTKDKTYVNGETLSYSAQLITDRLKESSLIELNPDQPLSFSTPSVDVLNGPTTLGSEVGVRIAQGVFLVLQALSEGKTDIQLAGHSRGGVEALLIAHELDRIKAAIRGGSSKTLLQILKDSPCPYTQRAFEDARVFTEANESSDVRRALAGRLDSAKIHLFLIDPVPGGRYRGVPGIAWRDSRFYKKPPCTSVELVVCRDERTRCFILVVPKEVTPVLMPGHHGTPSGNLFTQQGEPVPETYTNRDTATVQQLVLCKFIQFMDKNTKIFAQIPPQGSISLAHPVLDDITTRFLRGDKPQRMKALLLGYQRVCANNAAYQYFATNSYAILGHEQTVSGSRYIHYGSHNHASLDTIFADHQDQFVNTEHASLHLHDSMGFPLSSEEQQPDELMNSLTIALNTLFMDFANKRTAAAVALFASESARRDTFSAISLFMDAISQKYLRNHLTVERKVQLFAELDKTFRVLSTIKKSPIENPINTLIAECEDILRTGIRNTAQKYYQSLLEQSDMMNQRLKYFLAPEAQFTSTFEMFTKHLGEAPNELVVAVGRALAAITPVHIDSVRRVLNEEIQRLSEIDTATAREASTTILRLMREQSPNMDVFFEAALLNENELLANLDRLFTDIESFINGKDHIQRLIAEPALDINVELLEMHKRRIIELAAKIMNVKRLSLTGKPENISTEFFLLIKAQAIALGRKDPAITDLESRLALLQTQLERQAHQFTELSAEGDRQKQEIAELRKSMTESQDQLQIRITDLLAQKDVQTSKIVELTGRVKEQEGAIETLTARIKEQENLIAELRIRIQQLEQRIEELTARKKAQESSIVELRTTTQEQETLIAELRAVIKAQEVTITELTNQLNAEKELIRQLHTPEEIKAAHFIETQLVPLTQNYLLHLIHDAKKINPIDPEFDFNDELPEFTGEATNQIMYEKIAAKYTIAQNLLNGLIDKEATPLPSGRITQFTESLQENNTQLAQHRDDEWKCYVKNCLVAIAVVCSGIVPGIIALLAYSAYADKSTFLFFKQSDGEQYRDKANAKISQCLGMSA